MRPFYTKDGRLIVPVDHMADFTGNNNSSKSKVLIYLLHRKGQYRTARQIHEETGANYDYLRARLSFWFNIRYINRRVVTHAKGRPMWAYCIAERGEHFVNDRIPTEKRDHYISEINLWRFAVKQNACSNI